MRTFFSSDTHFGHFNILKYSNRPFSSVEEMNETLIQNWNNTVTPKDTIYHLGDVAFLKAPELDLLLGRLNGQKHLILGNHDKVLRNTPWLCQKHFISVSEYKEIRVKDKDVVLCHFPMITWNKSHHGSYMLHGHCHGTLKYPFPARIMDVGVDPQGMFPISDLEVIERMEKIEMKKVDHHGD